MVCETLHLLYNNTESVNNERHLFRCLSSCLRRVRQMSAEKPTRPTRGLTSQTTDRGATDGGGGDDGGDEGGEEEEAGGSGGEGGGGGFNVADLVPRTDIR